MAITETVIRRYIRLSMLLMLAIASIALVGLYFEVSHLFSNKAAAYAIIAGELVALSLLPPWSARIAKLRKIERTQRLAAYKASPEAHILHLTD
jgi:O-antigen/teichoic acid export membrane protein